MIVLRVLAAALLIAGAAFVFLASRKYDVRRDFLERARPATAEVVEVISHKGSGRRAGSWNAYKLRFTTSDGVAVLAEADDTDSLTEHRKGETVAVVYAPDHPVQVAIDTFSHRWSRAGLPAVFGTGLLIQSLLLFWITAAPARDMRTEATRAEFWSAFKHGRLRRDSTFQPLVVACSFLGTALAMVATLVLFFAGTHLKILVAILCLCAVFLAWRGMTKGRRAPR